MSSIRNMRLLRFIDCDKECGLEIGPLDKPLVTRKEGREIYYCDYANREELQRKSMSDPAVKVDLIPEIDFVAPRIDSRTFDGKRFDYIIASHVIEHVPDVVSWLRVLLDSLTEKGRIVLAVPDKRYTFDYWRPLSTTGQVLRAFFEKKLRPSLDQVYDGFSQAVRIDARLTWRNAGEIGNCSRQFSRTYSLRLAKDCFENGAYHDCHCWVFTFDSFVAIIEELQELDFLPARIVAADQPVYGSNEFHVVLSAVAPVAALEKYDRKVIRQPPSDRGKDDGWYFVENGCRRWIVAAAWLEENGLIAENVVEVSSEEFYSIEEGAPIVTK